jgi:hypothetical protein
MTIGFNFFPIFTVPKRIKQLYYNSNTTYVSACCITLTGQKPFYKNTGRIQEVLSIYPPL